MRLTDEERRELRWLARQVGPVWGGVYDRGGDEFTSKMMRLGYVASVECPVRVGKSKFSGGYRITPAGRAALKAQEAQDATD